MIDLNILRNDPDKLRKSLKDRNFNFDLDGVIALDVKRRQIVTELEQFNQIKNAINDAISKLLKEKKDARSRIAEMKGISQKIAELKPQAEALTCSLDAKCLLIPNIPSDVCPVGANAAANRIVRESGERPKFVFKPKTHIELGESLGLLDLKKAAELSGSGFVLFKGAGARLERSLISLMLDTHTGQHGYREVSPPVLVRRACMEGTGQLPKFEEDMYRIYRGSAEAEEGQPSKNDLFLIPTGEVPLTNLHRDEVLREEDLPISYAAYTPCFRLEAGAYGKETKGMNRVHQFDKVELVKFCKPDDSEAEHQKLLGHATHIFDLLNIPYRVQLLATGDLGFAANKCYDIEVWAPGMGEWLEASSCSNFADFQARRAGIKYKDKASKKSQFVHTLNGSGVALARTFIALIENHQQPDGSVFIPAALRPYMGGKTHIKEIN